MEATDCQVGTVGRMVQELSCGVSHCCAKDDSWFHMARYFLWMAFFSRVMCLTDHSAMMILLSKKIQQKIHFGIPETVKTPCMLWNCPEFLCDRGRHMLPGHGGSLGLWSEMVDPALVSSHNAEKKFISLLSKSKRCHRLLPILLALCSGLSRWSTHCADAVLQDVMDGFCGLTNG